MLYIIVTILIIWFNTDAFIEYGKILHLPYIKIKEYFLAKEKDCTLTYHTYLLYKHNNFFTRLITCPICTTSWLCIFSYVFVDITFIETLQLFIFSLLLYGLFNKLMT